MHNMQESKGLTKHAQLFRDRRACIASKRAAMTVCAGLPCMLLLVFLCCCRCLVRLPRDNYMRLTFIASAISCKSFFCLA
jgi:hypothetical protein